MLFRLLKGLKDENYRGQILLRKDNEFTILVTSSGTGSAVSVIKTLKRQNEIKLKLIAVDSDQLSAGLQLADYGHIVPNCGDPEYIPELLKICKEYGVSTIFPTYSKEILKIAKNKAYFDELGVNTLLPNPETIELCDDKRRMYDVVSELGIDVPKEYLFRTGELDLNKINDYPLIFKPNTSSGSKGVSLVHNKEELLIAVKSNEDFILQEYCSGDEYTVDVLVDNNHDLLVSSPRIRLSVKAGQMVKGVTKNVPRLNDFCKLICKEIGAVGPGNIQFFREGERFVFSEYNPRFAAGGLMLTIEAGANIPLMAVKLANGIECHPKAADPEITMIRYYEEVFLGKGE